MEKRDDLGCSRTVVVKIYPSFSGAADEGKFKSHHLMRRSNISRDSTLLPHLVIHTTGTTKGKRIKN